MTPLAVSNIFAVLGVLVFVGIIYLVKNIFDSERILATHPYFKNKPLRLLLTGLAVSPIASIFQPEYFVYSWALFLFFLTGALLAFGYLYDRHITKIAVNYSGIVGQSVYLGIPTTHYVTISQGIKARRVPNRIDPEWLKLKATFQALKNIDFKKYYIVIEKYEQGGYFSQHTHLISQVIHVLKGTVEMMEGVTAKPGDTVEIPAMEPHYLKPYEPGLCVIEYRKVP